MSAIKNIIDRDFTEEKYRRRDIRKIRTLFDLSAKDKYTIDDSTWNDLMMDDVFKKIDRTYTSQGEASLYTLLRNPVFDKKKLNKRHAIINHFKENKDLAVKLRYIFFNMGGDPDNKLIDMLEGKLLTSKIKPILYTFTGILCPIPLILLAIIFQFPQLLLAASFFLYLNIGIYQSEAKNIKAKGISKLTNMFTASHKILKLNSPVLDSYNIEIENCLEELKIIDKCTKILRFTSALNGLLESITVPFLLEVIGYYKITPYLADKENEILKLYYIIGEIDALISMASFEMSYEDKISIPNFTEDIRISIEEGIHPLLENPVSNSITIDKKGIILTGTNMSGKSTFLRMISTNILFAQTFNIVFAKNYTACFFNLVTSISPKDDINSGKSYYMAEAESLLRIINALDDDVPVFTTIDEIFRGTNPIERISSSAEILRYINERKGICIAATHDQEISDILKDSYDFYYFSESVSNEHGLNFDYKLKKGVTNTRNAIKLLEFLGYPKEIIDKSYDRCKTLTNYF